jgi:lysophospholipase L1-like esterase
VTGVWARRLLALGASTALSLAVAEGVARVAAADERFYDVEMWRYARELKVAVDDPERVFAHRPGVDTTLYGVRVHTNKMGFRDDTEVDPTRGERRVLLLGDSFAMGWGTPVEDIFATRLPVLLADLGPVRVLNTGVGAYNTTQELATARALGDHLKPEAVLVVWIINDAEPLPAFRPDVWWMRSRLALLAWSRGERLRRTADPGSAWEAWYRALYVEGAPGWEASKAAFAGIGAWCRERGIPGVVALVPELHVLGPDYPFAEVHERVRIVAETAGLRVVDLRETFPAGSGRPFWVSDEDAHANAEGHRRIAEGIAPMVREVMAAAADPSGRSATSSAGGAGSAGVIP